MDLIPTHVKRMMQSPARLTQAGMCRGSVALDFRAITYAQFDGGIAKTSSLASFRAPLGAIPSVAVYGLMESSIESCRMIEARLETPTRELLRSHAATVERVSRLEFLVAF